MDPPRERRRLNQGVGFRLVLHRSGELLMQGTASIELVVVFHLPCMPAGGLRTRSPSLLIGPELLNHLQALLG